MKPRTSPARYPVKSLAKAMRLLDVLGHFQNGTSIATLSKELKMSSSTVHRLLATLREFDVVWFDPSTANYALGSRIMSWSTLLVQQNLLLRYGMPILRDLVHLCRETANLGVLDRREILFVAQFESMEMLRMTHAVGTRVPAHSSSMGKALLATLPDAEVDELYRSVRKLERLTPNSIVDKRSLREQLHKVRQEGVAYDFEENHAGLFCVGAVVRNFTNKPVAAMSISMPIQRMRDGMLATIKEHLLNASATLSAELGSDLRNAPSVS
jgi:DNA-binding IclR family transcriptional regulator